jgi:hypothetical protein
MSASDVMAGGTLLASSAKQEGIRASPPTAAPSASERSVSSAVKNFGRMGKTGVSGGKAQKSFRSLGLLLQHPFHLGTLQV